MLRAYRFESPEYIPVNFNVSLSCWNDYEPEKLEQLILDHPLLFPHYERGSIDFDDPPYAPWRRKDVRYVDSWGCVWKTDQDGLTGTVIERPLDSWDDFADFEPPDPENQNGWGEIDWEEMERRAEKAREERRPVRFSLRHGHLFMTLYYLRGYQNLTLDMHREEPRLTELIEMIENFSAALLDRFLELDPDIIGFPEDLGTQDNPLITPQHFRKYIKPVYRRLMAKAKEAGALVHMHSDGYIMDLIDDILECGVDVINPQDLVNGIDDLRERVKGRAAIDLDVDRQKVVTRGSSEEVRELIREEGEKLGDPRGGLSLTHGLYSTVPLENVAALMDAMEEYAFFYS